jgi:hypothetical protein
MVAGCECFLLKKKKKSLDRNDFMMYFYGRVYWILG